MKHAEILYLTYDGLTDQLGQSQILPYLRALSEEYSITIISFEKKENFSILKDDIRQSLHGTDIEWHPLSYHKKPPVLSTLWDINRLILKIKSLRKKKNFHLLHCRSYITAIAGLYFRKRGLPFIFDMRGFWADERVEGGIWDLKHPLYRKVYNYFKQLENKFLTRASHIISLTIAGKDLITKGVPACPPVTVIPCSADMELFSRRKNLTEEDIKKKAGLSRDSKTLVYLGAIGTWYMLKEMLEFFKVLHIHDKNYRFLFVTRENPEKILEEATKQGIATDLIKVVSAKRSEVPEYLQIADTGIFFIKPVFSKQASSPTKQGEMMAMSLPVVCNSGIGDTDYVVNKYRSGIVISDFTPKEYEQASRNLLDSKFDPDIIRKGAEEFYGLDMAVAGYNKVYQQVLYGNEIKE